MRNTTIGAAICFGLLAFQSSAAQPQGSDGRWGLGPLRLGMTLAEIKEAAPGEWTEKEKKDALGRHTWEADNVVMAYGGNYSVRLSLPDGPDGYELIAFREVATDALDDCMSLGLQLVGQLERDFGVFEPIVTVPDFRRACFNTDGQVCRTYGEKITTPGGSTVYKHAKNKSGAIVPIKTTSAAEVDAVALGADTRGKAYYPLTADTLSPRLDFGVKFQGGMCQLTMQIAQWR